MKPPHGSILPFILFLTSCVQLAPTSLPVPSTAATFAITPENVKDIDAWAQSKLEQTPLASLAVGVRSGNSLYTRSYGLADRESGRQSQNDTVYYIGSITKQFTAAAIMQLVEHNKVHLDDSISKYISNLPETYRKATIHQLLSHTSGIPNYGLSDMTEAGVDLSKSHKPAELVSRLVDAHSLPLDFAPGTNYRYSNTGYFLLGMAIEKASGHEYGEYLQQNIFDPIGLWSMSYCVTPPVSLAKGYELQGGNLVPAPFRHPSISFAAGSICGTAGDLLKWQQALAQGQIVSPASYEKMTTPKSTSLSGITKYGYGLGITKRCGRRVVSHDGVLSTGYLALLSYYPDDNLSLVILTNTYSSKLSLFPESTDSIELERSLICNMLQK